MNDKWFTSSSGTGDLALTIKGLLVGVVPLTVIALNHYGVTVTELELVDAANAIIAAISATLIAVGLLRKLANRLFN